MRERNDSDRGDDALRITSQFRTREGMAYELRERGSRLTVLITERDPKDVDGRWRVEAFTTEVTTGFTHAGPTRAEALRRTGAAWATGAGARGLPSFDWDAVARALTQVRAI